MVQAAWPRKPACSPVLAENQRIEIFTLPSWPQVERLAVPLCSLRISELKRAFEPTVGSERHDGSPVLAENQRIETILHNQSRLRLSRSPVLAENQRIETVSPRRCGNFWPDVPLCSLRISELKLPNSQLVLAVRMLVPLCSLRISELKLVTRPGIHMKRGIDVPLCSLRISELKLVPDWVGLRRLRWWFPCAR